MLSVPIPTALVLLFRIACRHRQPIASDTYPVTGVLVVSHYPRPSCRCAVRNTVFRAWRQLWIRHVVIITPEMVEDVSGCPGTTSSELLGDVVAECRDVFQLSLQ